MLDPTDPHWGSLRLTPSEAFFTLLWEQLCDGSTHDAWQLRTMSLTTLLQELIELSIAARSFEPLQAAIGEVLDEAIMVGRRDPVLKKSFRAVLHLLEDQRLRQRGPTALAYLEQTALHLLDTLKPYPALLRQEVMVVLAAPELSQKKHLKLLASALGTELRTRGFSRLYLGSFSERFTAGPFQAELRRLLSLLEQHESDFRCILPVKWPAPLGELRLAQGDIQSELPSIGESQAARDFKASAEQGSKFFVVEVRAKDRFAAAQQALLTTARASSLVALYAPNRTIEVPRRTMLVKEEGEVHLVSPDLSHESYIKDTSRLSRRLQNASPRSTEMLSASLQYHALGVQAAAPESRLTNFWVALESLLIEQEGSIIGRVVEFIAPSLALSYFGRVLRASAIQLVAYLHGLERHASDAAAQLRSLLGSTPRSRPSIDLELLAKILLNEDRASQLFSLCAKNPLLIFRLNQLREKLKTPKELKASIEGHHKHVCWQLGRIYRARNSLVHRGTLPERTEHLIQHLHTYLSMTLHYLVREIGDSELLTVPAAFARRRALYDLYLSKIEDRTLTFRNLLSEATCWYASDEPGVWATDPAAGQATLAARS